MKQCDKKIQKKATKRSAWMLSKCDFLINLFMKILQASQRLAQQVLAKEKKFLFMQNKFASSSLKTNAILASKTEFSNTITTYLFISNR